MRQRADTANMKASHCLNDHRFHDASTGILRHFWAGRENGKLRALPNAPRSKDAIPWWLDAPSVMGFYGLFYSASDKWLWAKPIVRKIGLVKIPNLNGVWEGCVTSSSYDNHGSEITINMGISQTWARISIILNTQVP